MKWILIAVWASANGYQGVTMQEFDTVKACQWASTQINELNRRSGIDMRCVPKGESK
jgi:hypothetical protein